MASDLFLTHLKPSRGITASQKAVISLPSEPLMEISSFSSLWEDSPPWKKKSKTKKKPHRQVSFPVYLAGHQVQAIGNQMEWKTLWERSLPRPSLLQRGNLDRDHILLIPAVAARPAEQEGPSRLTRNQQAKFHGLSMQIPWCSHYAVPKKCLCVLGCLFLSKKTNLACDQILCQIGFIKLQIC